MIDFVIQGLIDRLENYYAFECPGGTLKNTVEWQALKATIAAIFDPENQPSQYGTILMSPVKKALLNSLVALVAALDETYNAAHKDVRDIIAPDMQRIYNELEAFKKGIA